MTAEFSFKQWLVSSQSPAVEALLKEAAERDDVVSFVGGLPGDDRPRCATRESRAILGSHGRRRIALVLA